MERREDEDKVVPVATPAAASDALPYLIELWDLPRAKPERVLGRAASVMLARAIFAAAQTEYLGRRIVLRRGSATLAESG